MFKKIYFTCCFLVFIAVISLAFITFKPVQNVVISDVSQKTGLVKNVEGKGTDIHIKLKNDTHDYYINNAFKLGLTPEEIKAAILQKQVNLYHINRWTPFTTDGVFPHISKLSVGNKVIFNEIIEK